MSARFVYAFFPSASHRAVQHWMREVDDVRAVHGRDMAAPDADLAPAGPVAAWRLVSDNHREIARACRFYPSESQAREDAAALRLRVHELSVHPSVEPRLRSSGWFATLDRRLVMMGARRYESRSVTRNAAALAVRLLTDAAEDDATHKNFPYFWEK
jgi:hypothetical protein